MRKWLMLLIPVLLLTGCTKFEENTPGSPEIVISIDAEYRSDTFTLQRHYNTQEKLRAMLDYLRTLDIYGTPSPQVPIPESRQSTITVYLSSGRTMIYEQRGDQFQRIDGGAWHYINSDQAAQLPLLLGLMESDIVRTAHP